MLTNDYGKYSIYWLIHKPNTFCVATEWRKRQLVYSLSVLSYMVYQLLEYAQQTWTQNISLRQAYPGAVYNVCFISKNYIVKFM